MLVERLSQTETEQKAKCARVMHMKKKHTKKQMKHMFVCAVYVCV